MKKLSITNAAFYGLEALETKQTNWKKHYLLFYSSLIYCRSEFPPLGGAVISVFWLMTLCRTLKNLISMRSLNCDEPPGIGHAHSRLLANSQNVENLLVRTPPRRFHRFTRNLAILTITGPSWQKVFKRLLIGQMILKLLNNNFLQIWFKTGSVAYRHIGVV